MKLQTGAVCKAHRLDSFLNMILSGRNWTLAGGNLWLTKPVKVNSQERYLQLSMLSSEHPIPPIPLQHYLAALALAKSRPCSQTLCGSWQGRKLLTGVVTETQPDFNSTRKSNWNTTWLKPTGKVTLWPRDRQNLWAPSCPSLSTPEPAHLFPSPSAPSSSPEPQPWMSAPAISRKGLSLSRRLLGCLSSSVDKQREWDKLGQPGLCGAELLLNPFPTLTHSSALLIHHFLPLGAPLCHSGNTWSDGIPCVMEYEHRHASHNYHYASLS